MRTGRLEAFSDGVLAIIITIMVLELHAPDEPTFAALTHLLPSLLTYLLSFVYIGIYWNNHHHLFQLVDRIDGAVLWANLHLLFWLSLIPVSTQWLDDSHAETAPSVVYGVNLLACAGAYSLLTLAIYRVQGRDGAVGRAFDRDVKGRASLLLYLLGIAGAFVWPPIGLVLYAVVALIWLIPDRRVERHIAEKTLPEVGA